MDARVRDVMTPGPIGVDYYQSIGEAARTMRDWGVGAVLVVRNESLYGLLTDRDLVVRAVAKEEHAMADEITVGGITVPITHPGKVLFPADGITKADLASYYADVGGRMLPWLHDRPVTMVRYPDGLDGQRFFQKNAPSYFPDWIRRVRLGKAGGEVEHAVCDKPATLVYLANQACIEIHGFTSRVDKLDAPDQMVFDFDPPDGKRFAEVRRAALWARDLLDGELGLTSFVRTTGGRGLHVHGGLNRRSGFDGVREFAHRVGEVLARRHPDAITVEQRKDKRGT